MKHIKLFEEFKTVKPIKSKKKRAPKSAEIENFESPKYLVQPAENDTGFFMFKSAFDKRVKRFDTGFFSTTVNNY